MDAASSRPKPRQEGDTRDRNLLKPAWKLALPPMISGEPFLGWQELTPCSLLRGRAALLRAGKKGRRARGDHARILSQFRVVMEGPPLFYIYRNTYLYLYAFSLFLPHLPSGASACAEGENPPALIRSQRVSMPLLAPHRRLPALTAPGPVLPGAGTQPFIPHRGTACRAAFALTAFPPREEKS